MKILTTAEIESIIELAFYHGASAGTDIISREVKKENAKNFLAQKAEQAKNEILVSIGEK